MTSKINQFNSAKEVLNYQNAIEEAWEEMTSKGFISINIIKSMSNQLKASNSGIRKIPATVIKNMRTDKVIFKPPQTEDEIMEYLSNLENYINYNNNYDSLINMSLIHYQFETIHPFYDGNGRIGRIINVLYLILKNKLNYPVLYLSKYIIENKKRYYDLLELCNKDKNNLHYFVQFMLKGIYETADMTIDLIFDLKERLTKLNY